MDKRFGAVALGLGTVTCLATAGLLLSPGKALAQSECSFGTTLLCKKTETCVYWFGTLCMSWYTTNYYYSKIKT